MCSITTPKGVGASLLELLPGSLPTTQVPSDTDLDAVADKVLRDFPQFQEHHFADDALWRDTYALTGTIRTFYFAASVAAEWNALSRSHGLSSATVVPGSVKVVSPDSGSSWIDCRILFTSSKPATECSGILSIVRTEDSSWKIWILRTILEQLTGYGNVDSLYPCQDLANGSNRNNANSRHLSSSHSGTNGISNDAQNHFQAVVIGGGQSGLSTGGRLQALGVSYVVLERNANVGDAWKSRYESARLHTVREYSHLPFDRTFGPEYSDYLGKDELAKGHRQWAEKYGINVWLSTTVGSGHWDETAKLYTLNITKQGQHVQITARHVVMATGAGSQSPVMPNISDRDHFQGILLHSSDYSSAQAWAGKSGIVVGTANTAHDVADDMQKAGMQVTMVQRSRTFVLPVEFIKDRYDIVYNEKIPTEISDRAMFSNPVSIARLLSAKAFHAMARAQPERYEALERAGFKVDPFGDIQEAINIRLGGHYIDVGTSAKIGKGLASHVSVEIKALD
ncbi:hypothetical protein LRP88_04334 [Fusarium phalaenopsidis]